MKQFKVIIEKHTDGYVGYPLRLKGVVVGQGEAYDEALAEAKSAIKFHLETFGGDELAEDFADSGSFRRRGRSECLRHGTLG